MHNGNIFNNVVLFYFIILIIFVIFNMINHADFFDIIYLIALISSVFKYILIMKNEKKVGK